MDGCTRDFVIDERMDGFKDGWMDERLERRLFVIMDYRWVEYGFMDD